MDAALPEVQIQQIQNTIQPFTTQGVEFHALRTRSAAARGFVSMHALVPGEWSVQKAHTLAEQIENEIRQKEPNLAIFIHVEPLEDPASFQDLSLDRT
jgi:divalent metal cation (Fe/Co/Zn/Cd) transporter